jgi:hypothetical protein
LVTSLPTEELSAEQWLRFNRAAWGIEAGLHQRLDFSHHDDLCRIRRPHSMLVIGMISAFHQQPVPCTGAANRPSRTTKPPPTFSPT